MIAMSVMRFIEMHMDTATIAGDDLMDAQVTLSAHWDTLEATTFFAANIDNVRGSSYNSLSPWSRHNPTMPCPRSHRAALKDPRVSTLIS